MKPTHNPSQSDDDSDSDDPEIDNWEPPDTDSQSPKKIRPIGRGSTSWSPPGAEAPLHLEREGSSGEVDTNVVALEGIVVPTGLPDSGAGASAGSALPAPDPGQPLEVRAHPDPSSITRQHAEICFASQILIGTRGGSGLAEEQAMFGLGTVAVVANTSLGEGVDAEDDPMVPGPADPWSAYGFTRLEIACPARYRILVVIAPVLLIPPVFVRRRNGTGARARTIDG
jgi:hypothetical protein